MCQVLRVLAVLCVGGLVAGVAPAFGAFPGGNGRIAFDSDRDGGDIDIWTMRPNGSDPINLTANSAAFDGIENWRADGRKLVFQSNRRTDTNPNGTFQIFVMNADGSDPTQITFTDLNNNDAPAWSPDGRKIVFVRHMFQGDPDPDLDNHDIWTMNADGSNQRNLTNNFAEDQEPNWSPDGRKIAFTSDRTGSNEVYTFNPNGSRLRQLTDTPGFDGGANWSPDSRMIAFDTERDGNGEIYKMRADGSHPVNLTRNPAFEFFSAWSPDGRKIAFTSDRDASDEHPGNFEVYKMRADGSRQMNLTSNPALDGGPDWQPLRDDHNRHDGANDDDHDWDDD
jgi:Tol biopolymer transport system component